MSQRMILIQSPFFITEPELKEKGWEGVFGRKAPLSLEIGCGVGDFVVQIARQNPEVDFVAIDIFNRGCLKSVHRVEESGLTNIRIMRIEARYLLQNYFPAEGLHNLYINCPDPWPKKRHRKRRMVNPGFLRQILFHLERGGHFYFTTDFVDYGEEVGSFFQAESGYSNCQATPFTHDLDDYPISKYMRRFLELGQPIYFVHYRKRPDLMLEECPQPDYRQGFRVPWGEKETPHTAPAGERSGKSDQPVEK